MSNHNFVKKHLLRGGLRSNFQSKRKQHRPALQDYCLKGFLNVQGLELLGSLHAPRCHMKSECRKYAKDCVHIFFANLSYRGTLLDRCLPCLGTYSCTHSARHMVPAARWPQQAYDHIGTDTEILLHRSIYLPM